MQEISLGNLEIGLILVAVSLIDLWIYELVFPICLVDQKPWTKKDIFKHLINYKPLNCERCLGFWTGVIFLLITGNIIYLTLPLIIKLKNRL